MNILDKIREYKYAFVRASRDHLSCHVLNERIARLAPPRPFSIRLLGTRSTRGAREPQATLRVVAEIKKASPSKGIIRDDLDPVAIARSYEAGGASCISVLTDERFFQGSLENLMLARNATALPVLRKDFILDPYQVIEARAAGADCILLIAGFIPWDELRALRETARAYDLEVLLEVHNEDDLRAALGLEPDVLGINNRDLRSPDFKTDLAWTEALISLVPPEITVISESGIRNRDDVARLARLGVDGILVGEHLMREPDPGKAIAQKLGICPASV